MANRVRRRPRRSPLPRNVFVAVDRDPQVIVAFCLVGLSILAAAVTFYVARAFLLPIVTAFVFAVVLAPICGWLTRVLPTVLSAFLTVILACLIAAAAFAFVAQPAARWVSDAPETLKKAEAQLSKLEAPLKSLDSLSKQVGGLSLSPPPPRSRTVVVQGPELTQSLLASAPVIVIQTAFVLVLTFFFLFAREDIRLKLIAFQPRIGDRVRAARVFRDVEKRASEYIAAVSLINIGVGIAVGAACFYLGLPEPAMWGGLACILNFVPYLGPAITVCLMALAGLSTFDTIIQASYPILAYFAVSALESNLVTPMVMSRRMTLNPLAIMLSVSFWTWIWGPVGGVVSLPLLIMLKVVCDHSPALMPLGALIGPPIARPDAAGRGAGRAEAETETGTDPLADPRPENPAFAE